MSFLYQQHSYLINTMNYLLTHPALLFYTSIPAHVRRLSMNPHVASHFNVSMLSSSGMACMSPKVRGKLFMSAKFFGIIPGSSIVRIGGRGESTITLLTRSNIIIIKCAFAICSDVYAKIFDVFKENRINCFLFTVICV